MKQHLAVRVILSMHILELLFAFPFLFISFDSIPRSCKSPKGARRAVLLSDARE